MAHHLRRGHHIATLDLNLVGMRTARRSGSLLRWHPGGGDWLGAWYWCERCREQHGEGWDRYYASVYWPYPLAWHRDAIQRHYQDVHPGVRFDAGRISCAGRPVGDWLASFLPLTAYSPAAFLCGECRSSDGADGPVLARRIYLGSDAWGDARRLSWLRGNRADLQVDLFGRTPLQQAELLEVRDRGLVLGDLKPATIHTALANARKTRPDDADRDYVQEAVITLLADARSRGQKPTAFIEHLAHLAKRHPRAFTTTIGGAIPTLAAQKPFISPAQFRRSVLALLNTSTDPTISERRLWDIWIDQVRDTD
jgi:hypothetical protein